MVRLFIVDTLSNVKNKHYHVRLMQMESIVNNAAGFNNNGVIIANEYAYGYNGILTKNSKMNIGYVSYKQYNFVKSEKYKSMDF